MAYVALSRVKRLENLHLIAFNPQSVIVSSKSLQEIDRLRQTYCPNLPQYPVLSAQPKAQKRKRKLSGTVVSTAPPSKLPRVSGKRKKAYTHTADKEVSPPTKKTCECTSSPDIVCLSGPRPAEPTWYHTHCCNPLTVEQQRSMCRELGLQFVCQWMYCWWATRSSETSNICASRTR